MVSVPMHLPRPRQKAYADLFGTSLHWVESYVVAWLNFSSPVDLPGSRTVAGLGFTVLVSVPPVTIAP